MRNQLTNALLLALASGSVGASNEADIVGEAWAIGGEELLYRELHACNETRSQCEITYVDAGGETIGVKSLDYSMTLPAPKVTMRDLRRGKTTTSPAGLKPDVVVDAGFDHFIRQSWDALSAGDEVAFPFLVLGRSKPLGMRVTNSGAACEVGLTCLSVSLDAWWLAMLTDNIELTYDSNRRLVRFAGLSNIPDAQGQRQNVEIRYRYAD
jgi:hypothetical protein